jgi:hypothetical protein
MPILLRAFITTLSREFIIEHCNLERQIIATSR